MRVPLLPGGSRARFKLWNKDSYSAKKNSILFSDEVRKRKYFFDDCGRVVRDSCCRCRRFFCLRLRNRNGAGFGIWQGLRRQCACRKSAVPVAGIDSRGHAVYTQVGPAGVLACIARQRPSRGRRTQFGNVQAGYAISDQDRAANCLRPMRLPFAASLSEIKRVLRLYARANALLASSFSKP